MCVSVGVRIYVRICANVPLTVIDFYCALLALLESRFACAAMLFN